MPFLHSIMLCFGRKKKERTKRNIKLQLEFEEKIEAIRSETVLEINKLKNSYNTQIQAIENSHREILDEYKKKGPNSDILLEEIRSLQVVIDLRNEEIRRLREDIIVGQKLQEDLSESKDQNKVLEARLEDIEAQLDKSRGDKRELQDKFRLLESNLTQMESENNRLSQCNEELCWKMQSLKSDRNKEMSQSISKLHHALDFIPSMK